MFAAPGGPAKRMPAQALPATPYYRPAARPAARSAVHGATARPRHKRKLTGVLIIAGLLAFGGGGLYLLVAGQKTDPDELFQTALVNALSTKSLTQTVTADKDSITLQYDVADVKKPRVAGSAELPSLENIQLDGYATTSDSFFRYKKAGDSFRGDVSAVMGKWIQLRKDGASPPDAGLNGGLVKIFDPHLAVHGGSYAFGDFAAADRQALLDLIRDEGLYMYDPLKVTETTAENQAVLQYEVTVSYNALKKFGQKLLAITSAEESVTGSLLMDISEDIVIDMLISPATGNVVKIVDKSDEPDITILYSDINTTVLEPAPKPSLQQAEFQALIPNDPSISAPVPNNAGQVTPPASNTGSQSAAKDSERKSDIDTLNAYIAAYYASTGTYPVLAELNDPVWVGKNMKGHDPAIFKDPDGTSSSLASRLAATPGKSRYAYQRGYNEQLAPCGQDLADCQLYAVSAVLSDGIVYRKTNF